MMLLHFQKFGGAQLICICTNIASCSMPFAPIQRRPFVAHTRQTKPLSFGIFLHASHRKSNLLADNDNDKSNNSQQQRSEPTKRFHETVSLRFHETVKVAVSLVS
jgi:hypothetical protein